MTQHDNSAVGKTGKIITLIHGTFAQDAEWTGPDSLICTELSKATDVTFLIFKWSGENSVNAREKAAIELTDFLLHAQENYPNSDHYVIAHSHGGNIALHSLSEQLAAKNIKGLITLATPFIHPKRRNIESLNILFEYTFPFFLSILVFLFFYTVNSPFLGAFIAFFIPPYWWIFFKGSNDKFTKYFSNRFVAPLLSVRERVIEFHSPLKPDIPWLVITSSGDEALRALRFVDKIGSLPFSIVGLVAKLRHFAKVVYIATAVVTIIFVRFFLSPHPGDGDTEFTLGVIYSINVIVTVFLGSILILHIPLFLFSIFPRISFGGVNAVEATTTRLLVSEKPPDSSIKAFESAYEFISYEKNEVGNSLVSFSPKLKHSIYTSPKVVSDVVKWIEKTNESY